MSRRRQHSELVWLLEAHAGFGPGGTYAVPMPEPGYPFNVEYAAEHGWPANREQRREVANVEIVEHVPCMIDCPDEDCREWTNVWTLPGDTRQEAIANLVARRFTGAAYHVSECEMLDDRR